MCAPGHPEAIDQDLISDQQSKSSDSGVPIQYTETMWAVCGSTMPIRKKHVAPCLQTGWLAPFGAPGMWLDACTSDAGTDAR